MRAQTNVPACRRSRKITLLALRQPFADFGVVVEAVDHGGEDFVTNERRGGL
jgi:hypothetical protein